MATQNVGATVDVYLSEVAIHYENEAHVAQDGLFPLINAPATQGKYRKVGPTQFIVEDAGPLGVETPMKRIDQSSEMVEYKLERYGLKGFAPEAQDMLSNDAFNLREETTMDVTDRLNLVQETQAVTLAETNSSFGTNAPPANLWDTADGKPVTDILNAMESVRVRIGIKPNTVQMSERTWLKVRQNPEVRGLMGDQESGLVMRDQFADYIEIPRERFIIAGAIKNNNAEGLSASNTDVWGSHCQIVYNGMGRMAMRWGGTFVPRDAMARRRTRREVQVDPSGMDILVDGWWQYQVIHADAGYRYTSVVS